MKPFNPTEYKRRPEGPRFQTHITIRGEDGKRVLEAHKKSGMTSAKFAEACIMYAIENMQEPK